LAQSDLGFVSEHGSGVGITLVSRPKGSNIHALDSLKSGMKSCKVDQLKIFLIALLDDYVPMINQATPDKLLRKPFSNKEAVTAPDSKI